MYSASWKKEINRVSGTENPLILCEIHHSALAEPVRVVNDKESVEHNGYTYVGLAFRVTLPSDPESGLPRARLAIDNIGKELMQWIELSEGARGTTITLSQIMRSDPDHVEWSVTMNLTNISVTTHEVSGDLSYDDILNMPGLPFTYRPETAPGIF